MIIVDYYKPEGHTGRSLTPHAGEGVYETRSEAIDAIKVACGGSLHWPWINGLGEECYPESDVPGCGGFILLEDNGS